jgi:hypothetical protein
MLFHLNETVYFGVVLTKTTSFWSTKVKQIMSNDASSDTIHHLQPLYLNNYSSDCFLEAFNASFLNQTKQTIHCRLPSSSCTIHHLQSLYLKSCSNDCFLEAFNASSLYQTKQTSHCRLVLFITFNLYT